MGTIPLSNSDSHVAGTANDACSVEGKCMNSNSCITHFNISSVTNIEDLTSKESTEDSVYNNSEISVVHTTAKINVPDSCASTSSSHTIITNIENGNNVSELKDETIEVDSNAKDNLDHQRCISQDKGTKHIATSMPINKRIVKPYISSASIHISYLNTLCCKFHIVLGLCCLVGCCLISIILYYVIQTSNNPEIDYEYSSERNTSSAKVCFMII